MMHFRANLMNKAVSFQRRSHGMLKKNAYIEENAGIREISYKTWTFTGANIAKLLFGLFIPSYFVFNAITVEATTRNTQVGRTEQYEKVGVVFSLKE